jgi:hypothetical protein
MGKERMIQILLGIIGKPIIKMVAKKGGKTVLLLIGDLIFKATKSKEDDKLWAEIRPRIEKFK